MKSHINTHQSDSYSNSPVGLQLQEAIIIFNQTVFSLQGKPSIHSIPIQLFYFTNLQRLSLCGNQLQDIPWSIIYLRQLKELDVSFNALVGAGFIQF